MVAELTELHLWISHGQKARKELTALAKKSAQQAGYGKIIILHHAHQCDWEPFVLQITAHPSLAFLRVG